MWEEKQRKLFGKKSRRYPRRTGELIASTVAMRLKSDEEALSVTFEQQFREYGIYVDAGTGREVYRNNPGDIGRQKVRKPKPWFSKKYYLSVMNLRDFYAENLGLQTIDIIADSLSDKGIRRNIVEVPEPASQRYRINTSAIPGANLPS